MRVVVEVGDEDTGGRDSQVTFIFWSSPTAGFSSSMFPGVRSGGSVFISLSGGIGGLSSILGSSAEDFKGGFSGELVAYLASIATGVLGTEFSVEVKVVSGESGFAGTRGG